jgi:hypothetical protein
MARVWWKRRKKMRRSESRREVESGVKVADRQGEEDI